MWVSTGWDAPLISRCDHTFEQNRAQAIHAYFYVVAVNNIPAADHRFRDSSCFSPLRARYLPMPKSLQLQPEIDMFYNDLNSVVRITAVTLSYGRFRHSVNDTNDFVHLYAIYIRTAWTDIVCRKYGRIIAVVYWCLVIRWPCPILINRANSDAKIQIRALN